MNCSHKPAEKERPLVNVWSSCSDGSKLWIRHTRMNVVWDVQSTYCCNCLQTFACKRHGLTHSNTHACTHAHMHAHTHTPHTTVIWPSWIMSGLPGWAGR